MAPMNLLLSILAIWLPKMTAIWLPEMNSAPVCGQSIKSPRIVGGQDAVEGSWPWQAIILDNKNSYCGGSLINDQWVLSAAHCYNKYYSFEQYTILLGAHHLLNVSHNVARHSVQQIFIHPNYDDVTNFADIALFKLDSPVKFSNRICPISLQRESQDFSSNTDCWVTGWGDIKKDEDLPPPKTLQEVKVKIINRELCNRLYNCPAIDILPKDRIKEDMFCAGYLSGRKDSCGGDSGGPLVCRNKEYWTQVGIVSWGVGCGERLRPGAYISVPYYNNWIDSTISRG